MKRADQPDITDSGSERKATKNRMELLAAIKAFEALPDGTDVTIVTDSQYLQNGMTSWVWKWQLEGWKTAGGKPVKNKDLWRRLSQAAARHQVTWQWVSSRSGVPENELADRLADEAGRTG